ncbi:glutaredoxin-C9-like [Curcuma longa]|uniref:glutaredoxin-C9-like n=1 Tax=Curcuma longa TaxID=136217 RepID=UPI003D9F550D
MRGAISSRPAPPRAADDLLSSSPSSSSSSSSSSGGGSAVRAAVAESPVVVVGARGCCMCDVARRLLLGLGVNPAMCEIGEGAEDAAAMMEAAAAAGGGGRSAVQPLVFVGGRLLGGLDRLVTVHITGELVPILKEAGALWL